MPLSSTDRVRILTLKHAGKTRRQIAKTMREEYNCEVSLRTITRTVTRYKETGTSEDRERSGRPRKCTERVAREVRRVARKDRLKSIPRVAVEVSEVVDGGVSSSTVRRTLAQFGLRRRLAAHKPILNAKQRAARLKWAIDHSRWGVKLWRRVFFTDEKIFRVRSNRPGTFVTRAAGERLHSKCIVGVSKSAAQIHVWGGIGSRGLAPL